MFLDSSILEFKPSGLFGTSELAALDELSEKLGMLGWIQHQSKKSLKPPPGFNQPDAKYVLIYLD